VWYRIAHDPAVADAILDRLKYSSIKLELDGDSMHKVEASYGQ